MGEGRLPGPLGLLHPLRPGDELVSGCIVQRAAIWHDRMVFVIGEVRLVVERPQPDGEYEARTSKYAIYADTTESPTVATLVARLAELVEANEDHHHPMRAPSHTRVLEGPAVYLVPGHLGDPLDLTLRALHVLAGAGLILVESHKVDATQVLLEQHGIDAAAIAGLDDDGIDRMQACLAAGSNVAIFGVNEGIPGFCDPGKDALAATAGPIRTVGGPSVLGMALMRVPASLDRFSFLGPVHSAGEAGTAVERWEADDLPAIIFSWGQSLPDLLARLDRCRRRPTLVHLLVALTQSDERVISGSVPSLRRASVGEREPVVVVLERGSLSDALGNLLGNPLGIWRRLSRRLRRKA